MSAENFRNGGRMSKTAYPQASRSAKKGKYMSDCKTQNRIQTALSWFSVIEKEVKLFATPFLVDPEEVEENLQLELIEVQCDDSLNNQHQQLSLPEFYRGLEKEKFPLMRRRVKKMIRLFGSTYIYIYVWANIFTVNSEQKQNENQNDPLPSP